MRGPAGLSEQHTRLLAKLMLAALVLVAAALSTSGPATVLGCTAVALGATAVLPRDGWPLFAGALVVSAGVAGLSHSTSSNIGWFAICSLGGWCAVMAGTRPAAAYAVLAVLLLSVEASVSADPGWLAWMLGTGFFTVGCLLVRRQRELVAQLREAQAGLAARVRAEERNRVARELHDVIAHSLTVSLLHVSSARLALADTPEEAAEALDRAEELGRQALTEVRHAVGLLREGPGARAPLPGAVDLPQLVDGFRQAGARVAYDVEGDPARLPATTGLTLYRILQEALTNAVRHGAGRPTAVHLDVRDRAAELTVDTAGPPGPRDGSGIGLHSMRERAEALGGELTAGPSNGGWRVHAVLPS